MKRLHEAGPLEFGGVFRPFFTIDRINVMLIAEGMPRCQEFTRSIPGVSREAQACGALERKERMTGLEVEHIRFAMKDGRRVKMLLGERVRRLEEYFESRNYVDDKLRGGSHA
jgi:hypothetical protein